MVGMSPLDADLYTAHSCTVLTIQLQGSGETRFSDDG